MTIDSDQLLIVTDDVVEEKSIITLTPLAAETVKRLMAEKELTDHGLRVFVAGGGCSGMQYGMAFEENPQANDEVIELNGVRVIVDPTSLGYLQGVTIDYVDNLMGGGFRIENPNAVSSCGCGQSFRTTDSGPAPGYGGGCGC